MTKKKILSKKPSKPVIKKKASAPLKSKSQKPLKPISAKTKSSSKISPAKKTTPKIASKKPLPVKLKKSITKKAPSKISPPAKVEKKVQPLSKNVGAKNKTKAPVISSVITRGALQQTFLSRPQKKNEENLSPFFKKQRQRLLLLKDTLLDSISGVARGHFQSGGDSSAFGEHQADAGSDAYDRDFALSILSQEQNSLYEIDEALKRIDDGSYGVCEISNKQIPRARLEARPFTRYTVECQAELEKRQHVSGTRVPVSALFGITEEESEHEDDENFNDNPKE